MMNERVHYKKVDREIQNLKENFTKQELFDFYKERLGDKYYVGQKVGKLTVEEPLRLNGKWWYKCRCECGNTRNVKIEHIFNLKYPMCAECSKKERDAISVNKYDLSGEFGKGWDSDGNEFWFDLEDYDKIKNISWHVDKKSKYITGRVKGEDRSVTFHRFVMGDPKESRVIIGVTTPDVYDMRKKNLYLDSMYIRKNNKERKPVIVADETKHSYKVSVYFGKDDKYHADEFERLAKNYIENECQ